MANAALKSLIEAVSFAAHKHRDQRRKDPEASPVHQPPDRAGHVLAVEAGVTDDVVLAAALLHDTIEDTVTTADELRASLRRPQSRRSWRR